MVDPVRRRRGEETPITDPSFSSGAPRLKRAQLTRLISALEGFPRPDPHLEQVSTPPEAASALLWEALSRGDLVGRMVLDLGAGTGTLAIGAALLGARSVIALEKDPAALEVARRNAGRSGVDIDFRKLDLSVLDPQAVPRADTVLMNPPFGAQRKHADRPFLEAAARAVDLPRGGAIYLLANAASQAFIERWSIERHLTLEEHQRSVWPFPRTFSHHREARGMVEVDRWILRRG